MSNLQNLQSRTGNKGITFAFLLKVRAVLEQGWYSDTSYRPSLYDHAAHRSFGQCWVTARACQEVFGWQLVINKKDGNNHYWNRLPDGREVDFTSDQAGGNGIDPFLRGSVSKRQVRPIAESNNKRLKLYFDRVSAGLFKLRDSIN